MLSGTSAGAVPSETSGAPLLRDQGPDRPAGHGNADQRLEATRLPAPKARSGRISTWARGERRRSRAMWCCPWLSAGDRSGPL
jgi:hypothetical protein